MAGGHAHGEAEEEWAPEDGAQRHFCTLAADMLIEFSFALMLVGCYYASTGPVGGAGATCNLKRSIWGGLCWGAVGFVVFGFTTGLALPPELPGMQAAELGDRQAWWLYNAFCTFLGAHRMPEYILTPAGCLIRGSARICFTRSIGAIGGRCIGTIGMK